MRSLDTAGREAPRWTRRGLKPGLPYLLDAHLDHLLARHPAMVDLEEILVLDGIEHAREALGRLRDDGLVSQLGGLVGTTRTFRRARALLG